MNTTFELAICVHCDARLPDQERRDGFCEKCGKPVLKMQRLGKKPTVQAGSNKSTVDPAQAQFREEVIWAVIGWTLIALALSCLPPLLLPVHLPASVFIVFGASTLLAALPLSWYLAKRSPIVRAVGVGIVCIVDLALDALEILSCFG